MCCGQNGCRNMLMCVGSSFLVEWVNSLQAYCVCGVLRWGHSDMFGIK
uniref:Post-SET domain-containing protein n=1 Tax=Anguilla anguilla TaxID=7936 RepID=A0A0E9VWR5_ANGAN